MRRRSPLDARWYCAAPWLYPPAFRREFSEEMLRDFEDGRVEAARGTTGARLWRFPGGAAGYVLARVVAQVPVALPASESPDAETVGLVMLATISIAITAQRSADPAPSARRRGS